jgi:hypothetical protein
MASILPEQLSIPQGQEQAITAVCVVVRGSATAGTTFPPHPTVPVALLAFVLPEVIEPVRSGAGQQPDGTNAAVACGAQAGDGLREH